MREKLLAGEVSLEWDKVESPELLNSVKYNYGKLVDSSNCCSYQKASNRLAICTEKALFIINLNHNWPQNQNGVVPAKFRANYDRLTSKKVGAKTTGSATCGEITKSSFQIEAWQTDLFENKNEFLSINLIRSPGKSAGVENIYREFFQIEENFKRKSFHRQIKELIDSNKRAKSESNFNNSNSISLLDNSENDGTSSVDRHLQIIESNLDQYMRHKQITEQHRLYDTALHDYLSFLNLVNNPNQQPITTMSSFNIQSNLPFSYFSLGYKYCKWNNNSNFQLLSVINACNQLLLFDCTNLNGENISGEQSENDLSGKDLNRVETYSQVFDLKTGSTVINLTELWVFKYRHHIVKQIQKLKTLDEYLDQIVQIIPIHLMWSHPFQFSCDESLEQTGELLFITLKSNEIIVFMVSRNELGKIQVELVYIIQMSKIESKLDEMGSEDEANVPSLLSITENSWAKSRQITSTCFWHDDDSTGVLAYASYNGDIYLTSLGLAEFNYKEPKIDHSYFKVENILNLGPIESIKMHKISRTDQSVKLLIFAVRESSLIFTIVEYNFNADQFIQSINRPVFYNHNNDEGCSNKKPNFLIQTSSRLVRLKLMSEHIIEQDNKSVLEFWLIFENNQIKHMRVDLSPSDNQITIKDPVKLLNDTAQLKFDTSRSGPDAFEFKMTRQLFLSNNNTLAFQVSDNSKLVLLERKVTQLELNLYNIKSQPQLISSILPTTSDLIENNSIQDLNFSNKYKKSNRKLSDLLWLFKRNLYLNRDFYNQKVFQEVYVNLKYANKLTDSVAEARTLSTDLSIYFKRIRILALDLATYFEMASEFDYLSQANDRKSVEDIDLDDDIDESIADEPSLDAEVGKDPEDMIVKTPPFYWSIFKELTLCLFRSHAFKLVTHANEVGIKKLTNKERLVLVLVADFCKRKNFLSAFKEKELVKWLDNNFSKLEEIAGEVRCDFCGKCVRVDLSNSLASVECDQGHTMSRCQRSLLPLDCAEFKACPKCKCTWNVLNERDYPNLSGLYRDKNNCLFCN